MNWFGDIFSGRYKYESEINKEEADEKLKELRKEKLGAHDIWALIIAAFQMLLPFVLLIAAGYFIIIKVITVFWIN